MKNRKVDPWKDQNNDFDPSTPKKNKGQKKPYFSVDAIRKIAHDEKSGCSFICYACRVRFTTSYGNLCFFRFDQQFLCKDCQKVFAHWRRIE